LRLDIDAVDLAAFSQDEKVLLIEEALQKLEREHPDKAKVVVFKFFGGLTDREAAESLGVTERTVERYWAYAKAWLVREIQQQEN
jgi:RNA polymerase sigma factor (sigma-70 family)